jgi:hypothetical protein
VEANAPVPQQREQMKDAANGEASERRHAADCAIDPGLEGNRAGKAWTGCVRARITSASFQLHHVLPGPREPVQSR